MLAVTLHVIRDSVNRIRETASSYGAKQPKHDREAPKEQEGGGHLPQRGCRQTSLQSHVQLIKQIFLRKLSRAN